MADSGTKLSPRTESSQNIFEIMRNEENNTTEIETPDKSASKDQETLAVTPVSALKRDSNSFRNLPGRFTTQTHVAMDSESDLQQHRDGCEQSATSELNLSQTPVKLNEDEMITVSVTVESKPPVTQESPVTPESGKRKRIHHDYRRLSSSGYVDDTEGKERYRSTSESDSTTVVSPVVSPPKVKPLKIKLPKPTQDLMANGTGNFHYYLYVLKKY